MTDEKLKACEVCSKPVSEHPDYFNRFDHDGLKCCPFCGGDAVLIDYLGNAYRQRRIRCKDEKCNYGTYHFDEVDQAITAWNTRANPTKA